MPEGNREFCPHSPEEIRNLVKGSRGFSEVLLKAMEEYVKNMRRATAKTIQETQKLIEAGFEYVCDFDDANPNLLQE